MKRQPLIGATVAARILDIKPPNFKRDWAPRLTSVPVEGTAPAYFRAEVVQLARERARRRNGNA